MAEHLHISEAFEHAAGHGPRVRNIASSSMSDDWPAAAQRNPRAWNKAAGLGTMSLMNTFTPYVVGSSCILKGGDTADHRMTELNELIASAKAFDRARSAERLHRPTFTVRAPHRRSQVLKTAG